MQVAANMPPMTTVPMMRRDTAPAPVANHKGNVPRIKHLSIFKREIMGFLEGDCISHRTGGTSQCHVSARNKKT